MSGLPFGPTSKRIAALQPGQSCWVSTQPSRMCKFIASAKKIGEPTAVYETETREGGVLVTRTA